MILKPANIEFCLVFGFLGKFDHNLPRPQRSREQARRCNKVRSLILGAKARNGLLAILLPRSGERMMFEYPGIKELNRISCC